MNQVLEFLTLSRFVLILGGLFLFWAARNLISQKGKSILTPLFLVVLAVAGSIIVDRYPAGHYNLRQLKNYLFPPKTLVLNYETREWKSDFIRYRSYTFFDPKPKLTLTPTEGGKYFVLENIDKLNAILRSLNLPEVTHGTQELAVTSKSTLDVTKFQWKDYPLGTLTVIRDLCRDKKALTSYHCVSRIIISY